MKRGRRRSAETRAPTTLLPTLPGPMRTTVFDARMALSLVPASEERDHQRTRTAS